jgi:hypothetical protein
MTDTGPQGACPRYCKEPEFVDHPETAPEECRKLYDHPDDLCLVHLPRYERPNQEVNIPQRVIQEVDCSEYFVEGKGYDPDAVPMLCKDPYISWWNSNHPLIRPTGIQSLSKDDLDLPGAKIEGLQLR